MERLNDDEICNLCITLIYQAIYMLHKLLEHQQKRFVENGGIREQMTRVRLEHRNQQNYWSNQKNLNTPITPSTPITLSNDKNKE